MKKTELQQQLTDLNQELDDLRSYLLSEKFSADPYVNVTDILTRLDQARERVLRGETRTINYCDHCGTEVETIEHDTGEVGGERWCYDCIRNTYRIAATDGRGNTIRVY